MQLARGVELVRDRVPIPLGWLVFLQAPLWVGLIGAPGTGPAGSGLELEVPDGLEHAVLGMWASASGPGSDYSSYSSRCSTC